MRRLSRVCWIAVFVILGQPLMAADGVGTSHPPGTPRQAYTSQQQAVMADLDRLLAAQRYNELAARMLRPVNAAELTAAMDWGRDQSMGGSGGVAVPLLQSTLLWSVGSSQADLAAMRETSGFVLMYAMLVAMADGTKCADVSAQGHGMETIIFQYAPRIKAVSAFPVDLKNKMMDQAVVIEARTAPLRKDDPYVCRNGLDEYAVAIKRQEDEKAGRPAAPAYQPKFLPREQWEPKQAEARKHFRTVLASIFSPPQPGSKP